jgi:hypothetical protein
MNPDSRKAKYQRRIRAAAPEINAPASPAHGRRLRVEPGEAPPPRVFHVEHSGQQRRPPASRMRAVCGTDDRQPPTRRKTPERVARCTRPDAGDCRGTGRCERYTGSAPCYSRPRSAGEPGDRAMHPRRSGAYSPAAKHGSTAGTERAIWLWRLLALAPPASGAACLWRGARVNCVGSVGRTNPAYRQRQDQRLRRGRTRSRTSGSTWNMDGCPMASAIASDTADGRVATYPATPRC